MVEIAESALAQAWVHQRAGQGEQALAGLDAALARLSARVGAPASSAAPASAGAGAGDSAGTGGVVAAASEQRAVAALHLQRGVWAQEQGRLDEAAASLARAAQLAPRWADAWHNLGLCRLQQAQPAAAAQALQCAEQCAPGRPATLRAWGQALARLGQPAAALQRCEQALRLLLQGDGGLPAARIAAASSAAADTVLAALLADRTVLLSTLGRLDQALHSAQHARQHRPDSASVWNNEAAVLLRLHRPAPALTAAQQALHLAPGDVAAAANRIRALHLLGRVDEALSEAGALTQAQPQHAAAWTLRLGLCLLARRWAEAAQAGERLLELAPATPLAAGRWLYARGKLCRWSDWSVQRAGHLQAVAAGRAVALPFGLLALADDAPLQRQAAQGWLQQEVPVWPAAVPGFVGVAPPLARQHCRPPGPWRVGWLSADFRAHAMARLLVGTLTALDPVRFEHHALSITPPDPGDPMQQRLRSALPRWHELHALDDERAARAIAALHLDVLVDLGGPTHGARPGLLARRPAPWQVAYLGFMGCSSTPAPRAVVDAVVADEITVPAAQAADFNECVLHLAGGLWPREAAPLAQPPAALPAVAGAVPGAPGTAALGDVDADAAVMARLRLAIGLPPTGFVFCNFCDATRLNPPLFDVWMRLLQAVPGSVLWLRRGSDEMAVNLQAEAAQRGVAPHRLVWAERLPWVQHLQRHAAADLFLDSWPCNGHTTVADALLGGLPVLTLQGRSMAARVAASQLHGLGLAELVCQDAGAYEALAVKLAQQPQQLARLGRQLRAALQVQTGPAAVRRYADALQALLIAGPGARPARAAASAVRA